MGENKKLKYLFLVGRETKHFFREKNQGQLNQPEVSGHSVDAHQEHFKISI
jgi:hypothetical protein